MYNYLYNFIYTYIIISWENHIRGRVKWVKTPSWNILDRAVQDGLRGSHVNWDQNLVKEAAFQRTGKECSRQEEWHDEGPKEERGEHVDVTEHRAVWLQQDEQGTGWGAEGGVKGVYRGHVS